MPHPDSGSDSFPAGARVGVGPGVGRRDDRHHPLLIPQSVASGVPAKNLIDMLWESRPDILCVHSLPFDDNPIRGNSGVGGVAKMDVEMQAWNAVYFRFSPLCLSDAVVRKLNENFCVAIFESEELVRDQSALRGIGLQNFIVVLGSDRVSTLVFYSFCGSPLFYMSAGRTVEDFARVVGVLLAEKRYEISFQDSF